MSPIADYLSGPAGSGVIKRHGLRFKKLKICGEDQGMLCRRFFLGTREVPEEE